MSDNVIQFVPRPNPDRHGLTDFYVDPSKLYKGPDESNTADTTPSDYTAPSDDCA